MINFVIDWEEYYDYIFPDDDNQLRNIKILEKAKRWKEKMAGGATESNDNAGDA